jgi:hypothetical protein
LLAVPLPPFTLLKIVLHTDYLFVFCLKENVCEAAMFSNSHEISVPLSLLAICPLQISRDLIVQDCLESPESSDYQKCTTFRFCYFASSPQHTFLLHLVLKPYVFTVSPASNHFRRVRKIAKSDH